MATPPIVLHKGDTVTTDTFSDILAGWIRQSFLPAIFPKKSFEGFLGGACSRFMAAKITNMILPLFTNGNLEIDAEALRKYALDGFEVSEVIPFEITSEMIPPQFRALVAPMLFDAEHPTIKCEFTKEDVNSLIALFEGKSIKTSVKV